MGFDEERRWAAGVSSVVTMGWRKFGEAVGGARASIRRRTVLGPVDSGIGHGDGSGLDRRASVWAAPRRRPCFERGGSGLGVAEAAILGRRTAMRRAEELGEEGAALAGDARGWGLEGRLRRGRWCSDWPEVAMADGWRVLEKEGCRGLGKMGYG